MVSERYKQAIPMGLVLFFSLILFAVWPDSSADPRFETALRHLTHNAAQETRDDLHRAESYIRFQIQGFHPHPGEERARPAADYYFRLAGALLARPDQEMQDRAVQYLLKAIELYPQIRNGWPYFQLGEITETKDSGDSYTQAIGYYSNVFFFNSGDLSLRAGYRIARLRQQANERSLDPRPVYQYIRFSSPDYAADLKPFVNAAWLEHGETLYLQALFSRIKNDADTACRLLAQYIKLHPEDYSAQYYFDRFIGNQLHTLYPVDGDLLQSCYAPKAVWDDGLLLLNNQQIRADCWIPQPEAQSVRLTLDFDNPSIQPLLVYVSFNEETHSYRLEPRSSSHFQVSFTSLRERNFVDVHALLEDGAVISSSPLWVRIRHLTAEILSQENIQ